MPDEPAPDQTTGYAPATQPDAPAFGNYELLGELGRGGMGVVYRARQKRADRLVALKVIRGGGGDDRAQARFLAEARALARISHPHIVAVYEVGEEADYPFFTMEFVDGGTLAGRIKDGPPLPIREAAKLVEDLAGAVQAAHAVGVLHRDIKPANVLLAVNGTAKLTDFGLAKHLNEDTGVTVAGSALGTPSYMSPEQAEGKTDRVGPAADVYSLGATLYELLTGRPPFRGDTAGATVFQVLNHEVVPPGKLRPGLSRELEAICLKCLEKDPTRRYASAAGLADDLTRWRGGLSTVARPLSRPRRAWRFVRRRPALFGGLLAVALGGVAAWFGLRERDPEVNAVRDLQRGKAVKLIGPTGPPIQTKWLTAPPVVGQPDPTRPYTVQSLGLCCVELLENPGIDRYRFSVEIRHTVNLRTGCVGFYFCRTTVGPPDDPVMLLSTLSYYDASADRPLRKDGDQEYEVAFNAIHRAELIDDHNQWRIRKRSPPTTGVVVGPWRKFAVEVSPERIAVLLPDDTGALVPSVAAWVPGDKRTQRAKFFVGRTLTRLFPGTPIDPDLTPPRSGLGLLISQGAAEFRNATIEPLFPPL